MKRLFVFLSLLFLFPSAGRVEVVLDGSLGTAGSLSGPGYFIPSSLGKQVGSNLFHSFSAFNLASSESATFTGAGTITNIISRITGGQVSSIDGLVRSTVPGANLYFINPAGIVFGPNASLEVSGSFHAGTAEYLTLEDGGRFDAKQPGQSVLTAAPPSAFGFLGDSPAGITVYGSYLRVPEGRALSLIGGTLEVQDGTLYAGGGTVTLVSGASAGEATFSGTDFQGDSFGKWGDIRITDTRLSAQRPTVGGVPLGNIEVSGRGGGAVFIRGGTFVLENGYIVSDTYGDGEGRGIDIRIEGDTLLTNQAQITTGAYGKGSAGPITIETGSLSLSGGSFIGTTVRPGGEGNGGDITVRASGPVSLSGYYASGSDMRVSGIFSDTYGKGKGGDITLEAESLALDGLGTISTTAWSGSEGKGGTIRISVDGSLSISGYYDLGGESFYGSSITSDTYGIGNAGNITISAEEITLSDFGSVSATAQEGSSGEGGSLKIDAGSVFLAGGAFLTTSTLGSGKGGVLTLTAAESLTVSGAALYGPSGIFSISSGSGAGGVIDIDAPELIAEDRARIAVITEGTGSGGDIFLHADVLTVDSGAQISSSSYGAGRGGTVTVDAAKHVALSGSATDNDGKLYLSGLFGQAYGSGGGGSISLTAPMAEMSDGAVISASSGGAGDAGTLSVGVDTLTLTDRAEIATRSTGSGKGGTILVDAADTVRLSGSAITAATDNADGGTITVRAGRMVYAHDSSITATVKGGTGDGGNIDIDPVYVILDKSKVIANADRGNGGTIRIAGEIFLASPDSTVSASSHLGIDGTVTISSPVEDVSAKMAMLSSSFLDGAALFPRLCTASGDGGSSFLVRGRDGVPPLPDSLLPSP